MKIMYILFDIGGSKMRFASSTDLKHFSVPIIVPTPQNFKKGIAEFTAISKRLAGSKKIIVVAGGMPGPLDRQHTKVINAPNLKNWNNLPFKSVLEKNLKTKVYIENDTAMVALGEVYFGSGRRFKNKGIVAYITISTGVGGARIVDGKIDRNVYGFEIGSQIIDIASSIGNLEAYISGRSVFNHTGKKPIEIRDKKFWDFEAKLLAYGLNNTIIHWSPDVVILGGSMMNKIGIPIERVKIHLNKVLTIFPEKPKLIHSALKDLGGLYGSMVYLSSKMR